MLVLTPAVSIPLDLIVFSAVRSQGAGGQHVNKTASAVVLRLDLHGAPLPEDWRQRLLARRDQRITDEGVVVIKAQQFRSQDRNRDAALERLRELLLSAAEAPRVRKPTRPTAASRRRRVDDKQHTGRLKALRSRPSD